MTGMLSLSLPPVTLSLLERREAFVDGERRGTREQLEGLCREHRYELHPAVVAFDESYGGLVMPDEPGQPADEPVWIFGGYACLASGAHVAPRGGSEARGLVPVVYSPNDVIFFLDPAGKAWAQDTIEDVEAVPYADDGRALIIGILDHLERFDAGEE